MVEFQNFVYNSLPRLLLIGKTQEAAREVNAIVSVLNAYALRNATEGMQERQQVRIFNMLWFYLFSVCLLFSFVTYSLSEIPAMQKLRKVTRKKMKQIMVDRCRFTAIFTPRTDYLNLHTGTP